SIPKPKSQYASFKYKNEQPQVVRNILTERDDFMDYYRGLSWFPSLDEMKNKFGNNSSKNFWSYYIKWVPFPKKDDGSYRESEIIENFTND
ncbi:hypothetical protein, partial [Mycoplasmopsis lipofaciens]|uniref:hypothetical protein n=1 Tax=Mycoplasmopsis lipofaciens TaxID=114884 RepID=UPI0005687C33